MQKGEDFRRKLIETLLVKLHVFFFSVGVDDGVEVLDEVGVDVGQDLNFSLSQINYIKNPLRIHIG